MLKLTVCGFLKFASIETFYIDLKAKTLLSAHNGKGKTSICNAIQWCLYEEPHDVVYTSSAPATSSATGSVIGSVIGSEKAGQAIIADKCYVMMEFLGALKSTANTANPASRANTESQGVVSYLTILRQKKPKLLQLQEVSLETGQRSEVKQDTIAQAHINKKWGNATVWKLCNYLDEARKNDFLSMSVKERTNTLYTFATDEDFKTPSIYIDKIELALETTKRQVEGLKVHITATIENIKTRWQQLNISQAEVDIVGAPQADSVVDKYQNYLEMKHQQLASLNAKIQLVHENKRRQQTMESQISQLQSDITAAKGRLTDSTSLEDLLQRQKNIPMLIRNMHQLEEIRKIEIEVETAVTALKNNPVGDVKFTQNEINILRQRKYWYEEQVRQYKLLDVVYTPQGKDETLKQIEPLVVQGQIRLKIMQERERMVLLNQRLIPYASPARGNDSDESLDKVRLKIREIENGLNVLTTPCCSKTCILQGGKLIATTQAFHTMAELTAAKRQEQVVLEKLELLGQLASCEKRINELTQSLTMQGVKVDAAPPCDVAILEKKKADILRLSYAEPINFDIDRIEAHYHEQMKLEQLQQKLAMQKAALPLGLVDKSHLSMAALDGQLLSINQQIAMHYKIRELESRLADYQQQLKSLMSFSAESGGGGSGGGGEGKTLVEMENDVIVVRKDITDLTAWCNRLRMIIPVYEEWKRISAENGRLSKLEDRLGKLQRLRVKSYEVKLNMVQDIVTRINESVRTYTFELFEAASGTPGQKEDQVMVVFELYKKLKTGNKIRPEVTHFFSIGGQRRPILSKGLTDRVRVALMLAFADLRPTTSMTQSDLSGIQGAQGDTFPLMILDDVLTSMDVNGEEKCVRLLEKVKSGVLYAGHRLINGRFDKVAQI